MSQGNGQAALRFDIPVERSVASIKRRKRHQFRTTVREWKMAGKSIASTRHPLLAHVIPMRRCNLACTYCNEYDDHSPPVPLDEMNRRIDRLADLGTAIVTISGGEPLMHPELDSVIRRIRERGMLSGLISNGYLMSRQRIESLNKAGLEHLQISIDNVEPDDVSKKSLKVLDKKLRYLAEYADFKININSVLGSGVENTNDAYVIAKRASDLGFTCTVGIIHDGKGQLNPLSPEELEVYRKVKFIAKKGYSRMNRIFQENLVKGRPNTWRCRAGARYLYICEDGLVHYCSQQRGYPGIPLAEYTPEHIAREFLTEKSCAPYCTIACVHTASTADMWRAPQNKIYEAPASPHHSPAPIEDLLQLER